MTARQSAALGSTAFILGCVAVALLPLVIFDMAAQLPFMPEEWWRPEGTFQLPPGRFDLRMVSICPGPVGWLGMWGYLAALVWIPFAAYRSWRAVRAGVAFRSRERILLVLVPTLMIVIELVLHLTPLKYGYPLL